MDGAPTVVSTFAGTGGSSLGYRMAGYKCRLAVEWDAHAVANYRLNFPSTPIFHGDIAKLSNEEALRLAGLQPGELDVFDGSPPCQGFSTAGHRILDDPRNGLFREYIRLLRAFQPRAFVMENVSGMVKGKMRLIFRDILIALKACGYRASCRLLNAKFYGVPQSRERVIFIGVRNDLGVEPSHPVPARRPVTVREAWRGVKDDGTWIGVCASHTQTHQEMLTVPPGENHPRHFSRMKLHWDRPSPTILKRHADNWHPTEPRVLTVAEGKRLFSFPDDFILSGLPSDRWARLGNSVPPLLMKAVAEHIRQHVLPAHGPPRANETKAATL